MNSYLYLYAVVGNTLAMKHYTTFSKYLMI